MTRDNSREERHHPVSGNEFDLDQFLPYRIRTFYMRVSAAVSHACQNEPGLTAAEWRVLATIGSKGAVSAAQIVEHASMDKVAVSRSVARLDKRQWLVVTSSSADRRQKVLNLSEAGNRVYKKLVPEVLAAEQSMLNGLSPSQVMQFLEVMQRIEKNIVKSD